MDVFPKFIVVNNKELGKCLIIAKCTFHKQLASDPLEIIGGGWWTFDINNLVFTLSGESHDFGRAKIEDITECVINGNVFRRSDFRTKFDEKITFKYMNEIGEIMDL